MINKLIGLVILVALLTALFVGGAQPQAVGLFIPPLDKIVHLIYYAIITLCLGSLIGLNLFFSVFIALCIGLADEIHQLYLPGRSADVLDLLADAIGISLSSLINYLIRNSCANTLP